MTDLYDAAKRGDLKQVTLLVEQGVDKNQVGNYYETTALSVAANDGHLDVVRYLVEQGAGMEKVDRDGNTPLIYASDCGHLEVVRYLLDQGADRDAVDYEGYTPLHCAAQQGHLETAKLLMVYGADLNMRTLRGQLPFESARTEEIRQAIRDEPRRRMDHGHKRATMYGLHPNTDTSASTLQDEVEDVGDEKSNKILRLDEGAEAEGKVAEEDEDSEPSDEEDD